MNDAHYSFSNLFLGKPLLKRDTYPSAKVNKIIEI